MVAVPHDLTTREGLSAVARLRERFLQDPRTPLARIRPAVAASWIRSAAAGVDPTARKPRFDEPRIDEKTLALATPILKELGQFAENAGGYVTLTAPNGALVVDQELPPAHGAIHGYSLLEEVCGTNSDGMALEEGRSAWLFSREHYCDDMQQTCCFSAIVRDPFRHNIRACIGLTLPESVAMNSDPRSTALIVEGYGARLTNELVAHAGLKEQALFAEYLSMVRRYGDAAVIAIDGKNNIASNTAFDLLRDNDHQIVAGYVQDALQSGRTVVQDIALSNQQSVRAEITPVGDLRDPAGAIVLMQPLRERQTPRSGSLRIPAPRAEIREDRFNELLGSSGAFAHTLDIARGAAGRRSPVHVVGERGVGKYRIALCIAHTWGDDVATLDARRVAGDENLLLNSLDDALASGRPVVLRAADALSAEAARRIVATTESCVDPRLVITLTRVTALTAGLLRDLATAEVAVPPLRARREDIPSLINHFASRAGAGRIKSRALRLLVQADWPGNVAQVESVIRDAAAAAAGADLTVEHLPQAFRRGMVSSRLSRLEEAELHELRNALHEAGGNRKLAADILQIGRSTLYRRLDSYRRRGISI